MDVRVVGGQVYHGDRPLALDRSGRVLEIDTAATATAGLLPNGDVVMQVGGQVITMPPAVAAELADTLADATEGGQALKAKIQLDELERRLREERAFRVAKVDEAVQARAAELEERIEELGRQAEDLERLVTARRAAVVETERNEANPDLSVGP